MLPAAGTGVRKHTLPLLDMAFVGNPAQIGIADLPRLDYGDAVDASPDEISVFWARDVTPQAAITQVHPEFCITHAPKAMLLTDLQNKHLNI